MECSCFDAFSIEADGGVVLAEKLVGGDKRKHDIEKDCNERDGDGCGGFPAETPKGAACVTPCDGVISVVR